MEREFINPEGIYEHPAFTRVVTVKGPMKLVFIAGQTPSDENYRPVAPGDYLGQYIAVNENLEKQLEAAGAKVLEQLPSSMGPCAFLEGTDGVRIEVTENKG